MKIECPVCHAKLGHKRTDDGCDIHLINKDGTVECIGSSSNGGDEVYCTLDPEHKLPENLVRKVLDFVNEEC